MILIRFNWVLFDFVRFDSIRFVSMGARQIKEVNTIQAIQALFHGTIHECASESFEVHPGASPHRIEEAPTRNSLI